MTRYPRKQKESHKKVSLCNMTEKHGGVPIHLKLSTV